MIFLQVLTRSDGIPSETYGETRKGLEFQVVGLTAFDNVGTLTIGQRTGNAFVRLATSRPDQLGNWPDGTFDFTITDDGNNVSFDVTEVGNPANSIFLSTTDSTVAPSNLVTFHNRERYAGRKLAFLDNVKIESLTRTEPEPSNGVVLGNSGWQASWDSSLNPFVDVAVDAVTENAVFIQKTAEFIQGKGLAGFPTIPITFTQIEADAVEQIVINDEVITNSTGSDWTGFRYQVLDGNDVAFNPDMSNASAGGNGFSTSPLGNQMFGPANRTFSVDGFGLSPGGGNAVVADGTQWFPGDGALDGELYIDVVTGDGSLEDPFTVFTLKGTPSFVPEPTTACLLALAGLILLASSMHGVRSRLPMVGRCSLGHPDDLEV